METADAGLEDLALEQMSRATREKAWNSAAQRQIQLGSVRKQRLAGGVQAVWERERKELLTAVMY